MSDPLRLYCNNSENCRRVAILRAIGSQEDVKVSPCCDVCDGGVHVPPSLLFEANAVLPSSKSRRKAKRVVDQQLSDSLKERLVETRDAFVEEIRNFQMIGSSFVCPMSVIEDICSNARFIDSVDSLRAYAIHPQLQPRLFVTMCQVLVNAPPPK